MALQTLDMDVRCFAARTVWTARVTQWMTKENAMKRACAGRLAQATAAIAFLSMATRVPGGPADRSTLGALDTLVHRMRLGASMRKDGLNGD